MNIEKKNIFINDRQEQRDSLVNTVYNNLDTSQFIQSDDFLKIQKMLEQNNNILSKEIIDNIYDVNNTKRSKESMIILPLFIDNYELLKYAIENKFLIDEEIQYLYCMILSSFSQETCLSIMDLLFDSSNEVKNIELLLFVHNILNNNIETGKKLLLWFYNKNSTAWSNIVANLINHNKFKQLAFELIDMHDCLTKSNYIIIRSLCLLNNLDTLKKYFNKIKEDENNNTSEIMKDMIEFSIYNNSSEVFDYLFELNEVSKNYECNDINVIFTALCKKKYKIAEQLSNIYNGTVNSDTEQQIINNLCNIEDDEFILNCLIILHDKIDLHCNDDFLLRNYISIENISIVKILLSNELFMAKFNKERIIKKIKNLILIISCEELINFLTEKLLR